MWWPESSFRRSSSSSPAAEESRYIFSKLGLEPWGRIGSGVVELIACILLLDPRTTALAVIISMGVISGAIFSHLTKLGIVVKDDGGLLFILAVVVFAEALRSRDSPSRRIPVIGPRLFAQSPAMA